MNEWIKQQFKILEELEDVLIQHDYVMKSFAWIDTHGLDAYKALTDEEREELFGMSKNQAPDPN